MREVGTLMWNYGNPNNVRVESRGEEVLKGPQAADARTAAKRPCSTAAGRTTGHISDLGLPPLNALWAPDRQFL